MAKSSKKFHMPAYLTTRRQKDPGFWNSVVSVEEKLTRVTSIIGRISILVVFIVCIVLIIRETTDDRIVIASFGVSEDLKLKGINGDALSASLYSLIETLVE